MSVARLRFRPLSGKWGYRFVLAQDTEPIIQFVSVPSRGNGVIDHESFSRSVPRRYLYAVSVPSRGNGVIDMDTRWPRLFFAKPQVSVPSRGNGVIDTITCTVR